MESWLSPLYVFPFGFVLSVFLCAGWLLSTKQIFNDPKKKTEEDKELLKKLLEGFGLEIPTELQETQSPVIKTIKSP